MTLHSALLNTLRGILSLQRGPIPMHESQGGNPQCTKESNAGIAVEVFMLYVQEQPQPPTISTVADVVHVCAMARRLWSGREVTT